MLKIPLTDIVMAFSSAIDMISLQMSDHHKRVAYIAYSISTEMGMNEKDKSDILMAGLLHDCGAIQDDAKMMAGLYDFSITASERHDHGFKGWKMLHDMDELKTAAEIIKFHHIYWDETSSPFTDNAKIPFGSYIIHLADRIDILTDRNEEILGQRSSIESIIKSNSGKIFMPDAVEAFIKLSSREYFWFDLVTPFINQTLSRFMSFIKTTLNSDKLLSIAGILTKIIDYRSNFTATHSIGVAECARILSSKMNFSKNEIQTMNIAGLLHDLGKLAIPVSILEKNGPLSQNEFNIMKKHTFFSFRILEGIPQMELINRWASFHHERIDGSGYPFGMRGKDLSTGSRIMAVSDVFTALTELRPYRPAMSIGNAMAVMEDMIKRKHLDGDVFAALKLHIDEINQLKLNAQKNASSAFGGLATHLSGTEF